MEPENSIQNGVSEVKPVADEAPKEDIVFSNKPKKKTGMILGMILFAILAIGGVGFGVWAMMDGNTQKEALNKQIDNLIAQNGELQSKLNNSGDAIINVGEDAWDNFSNNLASRSVDIMASYIYGAGSDAEYHTMHAVKDEDGHLVVTDIDQNGADEFILELDDVLMVYSVHVGNGDLQYFYIISNDGSVSRLEFRSNRQLEKVGDYKKIVAVFQAASLEAVLIDIDGNTYQSF